MAVRRHVFEFREALEAAMHGMRNSELCERLESMDVWQELLFDDPSSMGRSVLSGLVLDYAGRVPACSGGEFLSAFEQGGERLRSFCRGLERKSREVRALRPRISLRSFLKI